MMSYKVITNNTYTEGPVYTVPSKYTSLLQLCIEHMVKSGIKAICLDWDQTVLKIHGFSQLKISGRTVKQFVEGRNLAADFADLELFKALVQQAQAIGIKVWVVSFGIRELIQEYITFAGVDVGISTPSDIGYLDGCQLPGGKNFQLFHLMSKQYIQPWEILFVDDDTQNCSFSREAGFKYTFNVNRTSGLIISEFSLMMMSLFNKDIKLCLIGVNNSAFIDCNRTKCEELLAGKPPGKFIVRLAISRPFNVCVSYVDSSNKIVHLLVENPQELDSLMVNPTLSPLK